MQLQVAPCSQSYIGISTINTNPGCFFQKISGANVSNSEKHLCVIKVVVGGKLVNSCHGGVVCEGRSELIGQKY